MILLVPRGADAPRGIFAFGCVLLEYVPPLRLIVEQQKRWQESWQTPRSEKGEACSG
jgi:hypothetical protein